MKRPVTLIVLSVLALCPLVSSAEKNTSIQLVSPADGETVYMPHPHFRWERLPGTRLEDAHQIQIARDSDFISTEVDDSLEAVSRFVSVKPLSAGAYFWRVRAVTAEGMASYPSPIRVFRFSEATLHAGVEEVTLDGVPVRVFGPAKSVADCFRFRNKLGVDVAVDALSRWLAQPGSKPAELLRYARVCGVGRVITPYLEALQ